MLYRDGTEGERDGQHETYLKLYRGIAALVPNFKKTIKDLGSDYQSIMNLIDLVRWIPITLFLLRVSIVGQGVP